MNGKELEKHTIASPWIARMNEEKGFN